MKNSRLNGIFVPNITPFTDGGEVDEEALRTCVRFWLKGGVSGLVPCGSNGEAPYLSREERNKVIKIVVDEVNGKVPIIAGTGSLTTRDTISLTREAKDLGADASLVVTPFYYKLSNEEIVEHYKALLEAVDFPIVLYSVPKFTGMSLEASVICQLATNCNDVVGIKDSGGNLGAITEIIRLVGDKISVLAGTADLFLSTLMLRGSGAVVAVANVFPKLCSDLYEAFRTGAFEEASRLQQQVSYANEVLVKRYNQLSAIKEAMKMQGIPAGNPRMPALPLEDTAKDDIRALLHNLH